MKERSEIEGMLQTWQSFSEQFEEAEILLGMAIEESDEETVLEVSQRVRSLQDRLRELELQQMLSEENDDRNAIVSINAGAGGTEAQDWAEMLLRMYLRWCEKKKLNAQMADLLEGEEAGIKSATFTVSGPHAYGLLKAESGIHRLVRISPFDASGRRHTSFAAVLVFPEIDDKIEIDVKTSDLRVDTYRASGAGGQHVNKTSSAVRITHIPTGIAVACQQERSQHKNKATAMKMLKAALYELEEQKRQAERDKVEATKTDIAWGNQIRSYVFQPYTMVNDHRTDLKISDVQGVMNGDLDPFIEAYLKEHGSRAG